MLQWHETSYQEVSKYLLDRIEEPWMQELMAMVQEIDMQEVQTARSCGANGGEAEGNPNLVVALAAAADAEMNIDDQVDPTVR